MDVTQETLDKAVELDVEVTDEMSQEDVETAIQEKEPSGDGEPAQEPEKKEPSVENIKGEFERKLKAEKKRNDDMEQQLEDLKKQIGEKKTSSSYDELRDAGYDEVLINKIKSLEESKPAEQSGGNEVMYKFMRQTNLEKVLKDDTHGIAKQNIDEVNSMLDNIGNESCSDIEAVKAIVGMVSWNHINDVDVTKKQKKSSPTEDNVSKESGGTGGIGKTQLEDYALERGLDITDPNRRKQVIGMMKLEKKSKESLNKTGGK